MKELQGLSRGALSDFRVAFALLHVRNLDV